MHVCKCDVWVHVPRGSMYYVQYGSVHGVWGLYIPAPCVRIGAHMCAFVSLAWVGIHLCVPTRILFMCGVSVLAGMCMWTDSHCCSIHHLIRTQWQLSRAMVESMFTAEWVLTGVSGRAAVLSAQSA